MTTPNRIVLISNGRHEEYPCDSANNTLYPGHCLQIQSDGGVVPHATVGGSGPILVAEEDALQGGLVSTPYVNASVVMVRAAAKNDKLLLRLAAAMNVARGDKLMSDGAGALVPTFGPILLNNVADSTAISNVSAETTFSNGTYTIPANTLQAGDEIRIRGTAVVTAQNSTNTHDVKVYIGSTVLADSGAANLAANDSVEFDTTLTVRTIGASGTFVADGFATKIISGTGTTLATVVGSTAINTTTTNAITAKSTASAANTGNSIKLSQLRVSVSRPGNTPIVQADEAIDNSLGTATAFIRGLVL